MSRSGPAYSQRGAHLFSARIQSVLLIAAKVIRRGKAKPAIAVAVAAAITTVAFDGSAADCGDDTLTLLEQLAAAFLVLFIAVVVAENAIALNTIIDITSCRIAPNNLRHLESIVAMSHLESIVAIAANA